MNDSRTTEQQRADAVHAEAKAAEWLAHANVLKENGMSDETAYRKAQYWLDRANKLRGNV